MADKRYRLYVPSKGFMSPPVEFSSTDDEFDILDMVEEAISQGYFQFSVIFA